MALGGISFVAFTLGQGNDDVKAYASSSHIRSKEEAVAISDILKYGGEFGERGISYTRYELAPKAVAEYTATEKAAKRGRLKLELVFKSVTEGETGKKEYFEISDCFNDPDLIQAIAAGITAMPAGSWVGINQVVETVNYEFRPRKS